MEKVNIQLADLESFREKHGQRSLSTVLTILGKGTIFIQALESEVGKELLSEALNRLSELFNRITDDPFCDEKIRMEFCILKGICLRWSAKIMQYNKNQKLLKP